MRYLIDTNWIVDAIRGGRRSRLVRSQIRNRARDGIGISVISLAELSVGHFRSREAEQSRNDTLQVIEPFALIEVDPETCDIFGQLKATLLNQGNLIEDFDIVIAATALQHDLILLTNNSRDFARIDSLRLEWA